MNLGFDKVVGRNIRLLRKKNGFNQTQVADRLGVTFQQVQKYERGTNRLSLQSAVRLADMFNCKLENLHGKSLHGMELLTSDDIKILSALQSISRPNFKEKLYQMLKTLESK